MEHGGRTRDEILELPSDPRFAELADLIAQSPHNLVSRGERAHVAAHIVESLAVGELLPLPPGARWLDLGTGGGLPGLPLAIAHPRVQWTLLDSTRKKISAVESFAAALSLSNVAAIPARAEELAQSPAHAAQYDGVVSRAVARLSVLVPLARPFLRRNGLLVAVKGPRWRDELRDAEDALEAARVTVVHTPRVPIHGRETVVVIMRAAGPSSSGARRPRRRGHRP